MSHWKDTSEAAVFIASAGSRETSREIMAAIAAFARDAGEAETIWRDGLTNWDVESALAFVNIATGDGRIQPGELCWGARGPDWLPFDLRDDFSA